MSEVIQFPKKAAPTEEEELRAAAKELEQVNVQRKASLQGLRDKVKSLSEQETINATHMSPASVMAFRDAIAAVNYALSGIEAHDKITDMITHDIIGLVQNVEALSNHLFQTSAFTQTLLETLKAKGLVTADDMKETWANMVKARDTAPSQE
jgi:hypothetical protein